MNRALNGLVMRVGKQTSVMLHRGQTGMHRGRVMLGTLTSCGSCEWDVIYWVICTYGPTELVAMCGLKVTVQAREKNVKLIILITF